jgi:hypothetical protein
MKSYCTTLIIVIFAAVLTATIAPDLLHAQEPIAYPAREQSREQSEQDRFTCYQWARETTGFDPAQTPSASAPPPAATGSTMAGAVGGALVGVAIGAIAGHPGRGAAIGALSGGLIGGAHEYNSDQERDQYIRQQTANFAEKRDEYNRAWSACMEGRGYSVR